MADALSTLAENPMRHAILTAETRKMGLPVRRVLYRLCSGSGLAHHIYYTVTEGGDGPRVSVLHIRSACRRPIGPAEAKTLREDP